MTRAGRMGAFSVVVLSVVVPSVVVPSVVVLSAVVLSVVAPSTASAQDAVVLTATAGRPPSPEIGARLAEALESHGVAVIPPDAVPARLGLERPSPAPSELVSELGQSAEAVLELVASGETARAISRAEPVLASTRDHLPAIGRDARASADLANLCLYLVRAELRSGSEDAAVERLRSCLYALPDLPAEEWLHPPEVRDLIGRVRADVAASSTVLVVRAPPDAPRECAIRLNGRSVGHTPELRVAVVPGTYALQVECGSGPSPVRTIELPEGSLKRVLVSPSVETAVRIDERGAISLVYDSAEQAAERAAADAARLAATMGASEAFVAVALDDSLHIHRVRASRTGAPTALGEIVVVGADTSGPALATSLDGLLGGSSADGDGDGDGDTHDAVVLDDTQTTRPILGPVLLGAAGLAGLGVLTYGLLQAGCADEEAMDRCVENVRLATLPAILYGGLGAAAVVGAVLWFALGGSTDAETDDVAIHVQPQSIDVRVAF